MADRKSEECVDAHEAADQQDAPETAVAAQDAQWLAGVNRMARADASSATRAAATKRTAEVASADERLAKRAVAEKQCYDLRYDMSDEEWDAFVAWLDGHELSREAVNDWHCDPAYETWRRGVGAR